MNTAEAVKERRRKKAVKKSRLTAAKKKGRLTSTHGERLEKYKFRRILFRNFSSLTKRISNND